MKLSIAILMIGLCLAVIGYVGGYLFVTVPHRALLNGEKPELAWLKEEFKLSDAELEKISRLHDAYLPECAEMCRSIDAVNTGLKDLMAQASAVTPEIEERLLEAAQLRAECQKAMFGYFFEVSRSMSPEQGERFLLTVCEETFLPSHRMTGAIDGTSAHKFHPEQ